MPNLHPERQPEQSGFLEPRALEVDILADFISQATDLLQEEVPARNQKLWLNGLAQAYEWQAKQIKEGRGRIFTPPPIFQGDFQAQVPEFQIVQLKRTAKLLKEVSQSKGDYRTAIGICRRSWQAQEQLIKQPYAKDYLDEAQALLAKGTPGILRKSWLKSLAKKYRQQAEATDLTQTVPPPLYRNDNWEELGESSKRDYLIRLADVIERKSQSPQESVEVIHSCAVLWERDALKERLAVLSRYQQEAQALLTDGTPEVIRRAWLLGLANSHRRQAERLTTNTISRDLTPVIYGGDFSIRDREFQSQFLPITAQWIEALSRDSGNLVELIGQCQQEWQSQKVILETKLVIAESKV